MSQGFYGFPNILGVLRATSVKVLGKAGATNGAALAGGTASGAPSAPAGPYDVGDVIVDATGKLWICTTAGTNQSSPGSFTQVGGTASPLTTKADVWVYGSGDTRLGVGADTYVLTADSTQSTGLAWSAPAGSGLYSAYLCYQEQQTSGTNGGTLTSGAWRTRTLTTEVADTANHGTLASNQITLDAGTYRVVASAPAFAVDGHQLRVQNITDSATLVTGMCAYARSSAGQNGSGTAVLEGRLTLAAAKVIELQHRGQTTSATLGFGVPCSFGTEIYATIELFKE